MQLSEFRVDSSGWMVATLPLRARTANDGYGCGLPVNRPEPDGLDSVLLPLAKLSHRNTLTERL
jgi:hypothetical protein